MLIKAVSRSGLKNASRILHARNKLGFCLCCGFSSVPSEFQKHQRNAKHGQKGNCQKENGYVTTLHRLALVQFCKTNNNQTNQQPLPAQGEVYLPILIINASTMKAERLQRGSSSVSINGANFQRCLKTFETNTFENWPHPQSLLNDEALAILFPFLC